MKRVYVSDTINIDHHIVHIVKRVPLVLVIVKDRRGDQRGVNGSQSKFLTEFGLYPKNQPKSTQQNQAT
jgi:hypothetical protein